VRFALLGQLSVDDGADPVKVTGKLRRTLLAAPLLDAGTPVSAAAEPAGRPGPAAGPEAPCHGVPPLRYLDVEKVAKSSVLHVCATPWSTR
jgi:hypothetical protein